MLEENFHIMDKERDIKAQTAHRTPNRHDQQWSSSWHITFRFSTIKHKGKILKWAQLIFQIPFIGSPITPSLDFLSKSLQDRREWRNIVQVVKSLNRCKHPGCHMGNVLCPSCSTSHRAPSLQPGKTAKDGPNPFSALYWKTQKKLMVPGFRMAQFQRLWPFGMWTSH